MWVKQCPLLIHKAPPSHDHKYLGMASIPSIYGDLGHSLLLF